jgi:hypothetical protein
MSSHANTMTGIGQGQNLGGLPSGTGEASGLERVRFFPRQILGADDLNTEQRYFRERQRRHNRFLHGWGVACGCQVQLPQTPASPYQVTICPGYVITPWGDEIMIGSPTLLDLATCIVSSADPCAYGTGRAPVTAATPVPSPIYLTVTYKECQVRPVRVAAAGCSCDDAQCDYSRIRDAYQLNCLGTLPASHVPPPSTPNELGQLGQMGNPQGILPCPPEPPDNEVLLATITINQRIGQTPTLTIDYAERRLLYSTAMLQAIASFEFLFTLSDGELLREGNGAIWVIFGGAKFHVPDAPTLYRLYPGAPVHQIWTSGLSQLPDAPADGTLLREENGFIWVIFGGAKFHVPDVLTLERLYSGVPLDELWNGAPNQIPDVPVDGTLLREENGFIWVIFGGAKFHIPDVPTLERLYRGVPLDELWSGASDHIPVVPVDGTLLADENSAVWVIFGGAKFQVPDLPTLNRLYPGIAAHRLWNGAPNQFTYIPVDGTLLREESSAQVYIVQGGHKSPAPAGSPGTVGIVWTGALVQIPG